VASGKELKKKKSFLPHCNIDENPMFFVRFFFGIFRTADTGFGL
jgi:hypothetical protein